MESTEEEKKSSQRNGEEEESGSGNNNNKVPLMALNHVSRLCSNVKESIDFYKNVLGFVMIQRPEAFDFDGAWLFNYGVGIHLIQANNNNHKEKSDDDDDDDDDGDYKDRLDPMDNHISFQVHFFSFL